MNDSMKAKIYTGYAVCMVTLADEEMPDATIGDLAPGLQHHIAASIDEFISRAPDISGITASPEQIGHDLYLTRNGHGAGFWDRPEIYGGKEVADRLTDIANELGPMDPYLGDDGLVYA